MTDSRSPFNSEPLAKRRWGTVAAHALTWSTMLGAAMITTGLAFDAGMKAERRTREDLASYARLVAEHDRLGLSLVRLVLEDMGAAVEASLFGDTIAPYRLKQLELALEGHRQKLEGAIAMVVLDRDGRALVELGGAEVPQLALAEIAQACKEGKTDVIRGVAPTVAAGQSALDIGHCLPSAAGSIPRAVAVRVVATEVLFNFYRAKALTPGYSVELRDAGRVLIAQAEEHGPTPAGAPIADALADAIAAGELRGFVKRVDLLTGEGIFSAYERLGSSKLYAVVSIRASSARLESNALIGSAVMAALICIVGAFVGSMVIAKNRDLAKARDEAMRASSERQILIRKINTALEDERRELAVEIHDVLNAMLVRVKLDAQGILALAERATPDSVIDEIVERAQSITKHANDLYTQCRRIVARLRPETLDVLGLAQAVEEMIKSYNASQSDCHISLSASSDLGEIEGDLPIAAYRLIQEALSNVLKHASAKSATVSILRKQDLGVLELSIVDDGVGFDPKNLTPGIGVIGMRERAELLGGNLEISSAPGVGTRLRARLPLPAAGH